MIEQILQADRHLQVDQVEKARDIYQRVVDLDPGNAIATVGLARCALADGEDVQAYELASKALEIDPENEMARRMEARLSEILAGRGQPIARPAAAATPSTHQMRPVVTETPAAPGPPVTTSPAAAPAPAATPAPALAHSRARTDQTTTSIKPSPTKERPVRKSLFDRLMGR